MRDTANWGATVSSFQPGQVQHPQDRHGHWKTRYITLKGGPRPYFPHIGKDKGQQCPSELR